MKQCDFYKEIVKVIHNNAKYHDPEKLAFIIYNSMKQNPDVVKMGTTWGDMLKNMKIILNRFFSWEWNEVQSFLSQLSILSYHMRNST